MNKEYNVFTKHLDHNNIGLQDYDGIRTHLHLLVESGNLDIRISDTIYRLCQHDYVDNIKEGDVSFLNASPDFKGWLMGIDRAEVPVFQQSVTTIPYGLINNLFINPVLHLPPEEFDRLSHAFLKIEICLETDHIFKYRMLTRIVQLFMMELGQALANTLGSGTSSFPGKRKTELFIEFTEEIRNNCVSEREVQTYAKRLNVSPQYLNAVVKELTGDSASQYIRKFVLSRLIFDITHEKKPLKLIAAEYGFNDVPALFNYIKRYTGHTVSYIIENNR